MADELILIDDGYSANYLASSQSATARYEKLSALADLHEGFLSFLRWAFEYQVAEKVDGDVARLRPSVFKHLEWTGHKGAAVMVLMKRDRSGERPAELERVELLGSGNSPMDVLVRAIDEEREPTMGARLAEPYQWAPDASVMLWVTQEGGKYKQYTVVPGSLGALYRKAQEDMTRRDALRLRAAADRSATLIAIVEAIEREQASAEVRIAVHKALEERSRIAARLQAIEAEMRAALDKQKRIEGARAWISVLAGAISAAELGMQVKAMLGPDIPQAAAETIDQAVHEPLIKAVADMKAMLDNYVKDFGELQAQLGKDRVEMTVIINATTNIISDAAKGAGAPPTVVVPALP